jgi:hypothetical protein
LGLSFGLGERNKHFPITSSGELCDEGERIQTTSHMARDFRSGCAARDQFVASALAFGERA